MYYPKSQIKPNLYTNGDEYILSTTNEPYKGFYHLLSNGTLFTGKTPSDPPTIQLIRHPNNYQVLPEVDEYYARIIKPSDINNYNNEFIPPRSAPSPIQTLPTQQDKDLGVFLRYFCKKNNENLYIEINKEQFTKFQNKDIDIAWDLYTPKQVLWQIKGDKTQTYNANKNNVSLIEQRDKWYGFTQYFKDRFLKYYLES
jgi:hypothetical protein